jgi:hypothetical protein
LARLIQSAVTMEFTSLRRTENQRIGRSTSMLRGYERIAPRREGPGHRGEDRDLQDHADRIIVTSAELLRASGLIDINQAPMLATGSLMVFTL